MTKYKTGAIVKLTFAYLAKTLKGGALFFSGPLGFIFGFFLEFYLSNLIHNGVIVVDILINKVSEVLSAEDVKRIIGPLYDKAGKKVYTEKEKDVIRQEYLDILSQFGTFGNGLRE